MNMMNNKVDAYFKRAGQWEEEMTALRAIILECGLNEELKWGNPCYTMENHNIVLIHGFKEYCAMLFFKGALMKDRGGLLIRQTENVQAARQIRFTGVEEIVKRKALLKSYVMEAMKVEKAGLKVAFKTTNEFKTPEEFQKVLEIMPALKTAFETLTPGRQRGYKLYFSSPTQSKTRTSRIQKCIPLILKGKGLNDN